MQDQHWHLAWQITECSEHSGRSVCTHLAGSPFQVTLNWRDFQDAIDNKGNAPWSPAVDAHNAIVCLGVGRKTITTMLTDSNTAGDRFCLGAGFENIGSYSRVMGCPGRTRSRSPLDKDLTAK